MTQSKSEAEKTPTAPKETKKETKLPKIDFKNLFTIILNSALRPITTIKEKLGDFADAKNAGIIVAVIVVAMTLLSTITNVVGIVRTEKCVEGCSSLNIFSTEKTKKKVETTWNWENLSDYDWFKNVGGDLLNKILTVAILSGAYYGMAKAFKDKKVNFFRMATLVALGLVPAAVTGFVAPILGGINLTLAGIVGLAGSIYSFAIIFLGLNSEIAVEGDKKIYLNVAAAACMLVACYILIRFMYGELGGSAFELMIQSGVKGLSLGSSLGM